MLCESEDNKKQSGMNKTVHVAVSSLSGRDESQPGFQNQSMNYSELGPRSAYDSNWVKSWIFM